MGNAMTQYTVSNRTGLGRLSHVRRIAVVISFNFSLASGIVRGMESSSLMEKIVSQFDRKGVCVIPAVILSYEYN